MFVWTMAPAILSALRVPGSNLGPIGSAVLLVDRGKGWITLLVLLSGCAAAPCDTRGSGDVRQIRIAWDEAARYVRQAGTGDEREHLAIRLGDAIDALGRLERQGQIGPQAAALVRSRLREEHQMVNPPPASVHGDFGRAKLSPEEMGRLLPLLERLSAERTIPLPLLCPLIVELERGLAELDRAQPRPAGLLLHNREAFRRRLARLRGGQTAGPP